MSQVTIEEIDALLPQTQCTRCGYPSCRDYAEALQQNKANINQCPPGGDEGIKALAKLLKQKVLPLNPENGVIKPRTIVVIEEEKCIGCTLCIKACPVDAIIGSNKMMHTVLPDWCTGCDLCIPACPVDCIAIISDPDPVWSEARRDTALERYHNHQDRVKRDREEREARLRQLTDGSEFPS